jgi:hypothetical protein
VVDFGLPNATMHKLDEAAAVEDIHALAADLRASDQGGAGLDLPSLKGGDKGWVAPKRLDGAEGLEGAFAGIEPAQSHPPLTPPLQGGGLFLLNTM